jgi:hypothetical protein
MGGGIAGCRSMSLAGEPRGGSFAVVGANAGGLNGIWSEHLPLGASRQTFYGRADPILRSISMLSLRGWQSPNTTHTMP